MKQIKLVHIYIQNIGAMHQVQSLTSRTVREGSVVMLIQAITLKSVAKYLQSSFTRHQHPSSTQIDHKNVNETEHKTASKH